MNEPGQHPAKPTKLRLAIERAIARQQATRPPSAPQILSAEERAALLEPARSLFVRSAEPETSLPLPSDAQPSARDSRWRRALDRLQQRDRELWPLQPRTLEPISASELGRTRPQLRWFDRRSAAPEAADAAPELTADLPASAEPAVAPAGGLESSPPAAPEPVAALARATPRAPLPAEVVAALDPLVLPLPELRRPPLWTRILAVAAWTLVLAWLFLSHSLGSHTLLPMRLSFGILVTTAGLATWAPIQWGLRLPALTWRGTLGWLIVLWWLAFLPAPRTRLTANLAEVPVFMLLALGLFLAFSAVALPLLYLRGMRSGSTRRERFDVRRARRQANEIGVFFGLALLLAAMNVLDIMALLLLAAILGLSELIFLSLNRA